MASSTLPFLIGWFLGIAIVLVGWTVALALVVVFVNRKVRKMEADHPAEVGSEVPSALLFYALSVLFWPAGFIAGIYLLQRTATARQGRNCVFIGLADITVITVLTCVAMVVLALVAPQALG